MNATELINTFKMTDLRYMIEAAGETFTSTTKSGLVKFIVDNNIDTGTIKPTIRNKSSPLLKEMNERRHSMSQQSGTDSDTRTSPLSMHNRSNPTPQMAMLMNKRKELKTPSPYSYTRSSGSNPRTNPTPQMTEQMNRSRSLDNSSTLDIVPSRSPSRSPMHDTEKSTNRGTRNVGAIVKKKMYNKNTRNTLPQVHHNNQLPNTPYTQPSPNRMSPSRMPEPIRMSPNRMADSIRMSPDRMDPNRMDPNRMDPNRMSPIQIHPSPLQMQQSTPQDAQYAAYLSAQDAQTVQSAQISRAIKNNQNIQNIKNIQHAQNAQNVQNAQNAQAALNAQNAQNVRNHQNELDAQNVQNAMNAQVELDAKNHQAILDANHSTQPFINSFDGLDYNTYQQVPQVQYDSVPRYVTPQSRRDAQNIINQKNINQSNINSQLDPVTPQQMVSHQAGHLASRQAAHLASQQAAHLASQQAAQLASQQAAQLASQQAAQLASQQAGQLASQQAGQLASQQAAHLASQQAAQFASQQAAQFASQQAAQFASQQANTQYTNRQPNDRISGPVPANERSHSPIRAGSGRPAIVDMGTTKRDRRNAAFMLKQQKIQEDDRIFQMQKQLDELSQKHVKMVNTFEHRMEQPTRTPQNTQHPINSVKSPLPRTNMSVQRNRNGESFSPRKISYNTTPDVQHSHSRDGSSVGALEQTPLLPNLNSDVSNYTQSNRRLPTGRIPINREAQKQFTTLINKLQTNAKLTDVEKVQKYVFSALGLIH